MADYRKKQEIVQAIQWTGDNAEECQRFCPGLEVKKTGCLYCYWFSEEPLEIGTWIIRDLGDIAIMDEFDFEETYELVADEDEGDKYGTITMGDGTVHTIPDPCWTSEGLKHGE